MKASSIGKAAALASTVLLMGGYVWHQAKNGKPTMVTDTATGQAELKPVQAGAEEIEFTTIPGIPLGQSQAVTNIEGGDVFPSTKSAPMFLPGSKSDDVTLVPLPGSKSISRIIDQATLEQLGEAAKGNDSKADEPTPPAQKPTVLPGSKSLSLLIDEETLKRLSESQKEQTQKKEDEQTTKPAPKPVLPGSKVKVPIIPPKPSANEEEPAPAPAPNQRKPAVLPGSKSFIVPVLPKDEKKPAPESQEAPAEQEQK